MLTFNIIKSRCYIKDDSSIILLICVKYLVFTFIILMTFIGVSELRLYNDVLIYFYCQKSAIHYIFKVHTYNNLKINTVGNIERSF